MKKPENLFIKKNRTCFCPDTPPSKIKGEIWKMEGKGVGLVTVPLPWSEFMRWRSGKSGALVEHFIDTQIKIKIINCCKRRISKHKILNDATIDVIILPSPLTGKIGIYS